jgi:hypothetical protein
MHQHSKNMTNIRTDLIAEIFTAIRFWTGGVWWDIEAIGHWHAWSQTCEYNLARFSE